MKAICFVLNDADVDGLKYNSKHVLLSLISKAKIMNCRHLTQKQAAWHPKQSMNTENVYIYRVNIARTDVETLLFLFYNVIVKPLFIFLKTIPPLI